MMQRREIPPVFLTVVAALLVASATAHAAPISYSEFSDTGDLVVRYYINGSNAGNFDTAYAGSDKLRVGSEGPGDNRRGMNSILFFELPKDLHSVSSANLRVRVTDDNSSPTFHVDLYGLGYVVGTAPAANTDWFYSSGSTDTATGDTLGTNIGTSRVTKIQDNYWQDDFSPPSTRNTSSTGDRDLAGFLSQVADIVNTDPTVTATDKAWAVLRLNKNGSAANNTDRYRLGSGDNGTDSDKPLLTFDYLTERAWDDEGADDNWSTAANWTGDTVPTATDVAVFRDAGAAAGAGTPTNIVDAGFAGTVGGLDYRNTDGNYHTTDLGGGTLAVDSSVDVGLNVETITRVAMTNGDLQVGAPGSPAAINLGRRSGGSGSAKGELDLSAVGQFDAYLTEMAIGRTILSYARGTLTLAQTNTIDAATIRMADSTGSGLTSGTSTMALGNANTLTVGTFIIGDRKGKAKVTINAGGTLDLAGQGGGRANLYVGRKRSDTGTTSTGTLDLTGGARFDATLDQFIIGYQDSSANGSGGANGTAILADTNIIDANDIRVAYFDDGQESATTTGTLTLGNTNTLTANTLTLGQIVGGRTGTTTATLNLGASNTLSIDTMTVGGHKSTGTVTLPSGGLLDLTGNTDADNRADLRIGYNGSTSKTATGAMNLGGGIFDARLDQLVLGRQSGNTGHGDGTLTMGAGTVDVNDVRLGESGGSNPLDSIGNLVINGGSVKVNGSVTDGAGVGELRVQGGTMSIAGDLSLDHLRVGYNGRTGSIDVGGNVDLHDSSRDFHIGRRSGSGGETIGTADFSASALVDIDVRDIFIGRTNGSRAQGTLLLGADNDISAREIRIGDSTSAGQSNPSQASVVELNGTTTIDADTLYVGRRKSDATMAFGPTGGTLFLGSAGDRINNLRVGYNDANTGSNADGLLDFSGGTVTAYANNVVLGRHNGPTSSSAGGSGDGTLSLSDGLFDANDILLGDARTNSNGVGTSTGTINLAGGTLRAGTLRVGTGGGNSSAVIKWTGGTLTADSIDIAKTLDNTAAGILAPGGDGAGSTQVVGDYAQGPGATYQVHLDDFDAYDTLEVLDLAKLDGILEVIMDPSFQPPSCTSLVILEANEIDREFAEVDFSQAQFANTAMDWEVLYLEDVVDYQGHDLVVLHAVPEPATLTLLALGGLALLRRRRRS